VREAGNVGLRPAQEYAGFQGNDLESVVEGLLADEPRRLKIAKAAQARASEFTTKTMWA
jgi:hypothetical protein